MVSKVILKSCRLDETAIQRLQDQWLVEVQSREPKKDAQKHEDH